MIRIQNAGKKFGDRWIFRDLTLQVEKRESVVLVGPSGGGKSVLLKLVAGLLKADEGSVSVASLNLGMLFQKNALFDSLTVEDNLLFTLKERRGESGPEAQKKAASFLQAVGLKGSEKLRPDEISGGMQKRLGIARALIVDPEVILYDEPTAGLDPITSRSIADLINELRRKSGSTLLTVTNDMQRAYQIGDRICLLARGKLIDGGSPERVKASQDTSIVQFIHGYKEGPLS
jgi:phospholipid/cholesterol/gamma-HCH transport system ATP-binding protein